MSSSSRRQLENWLKTIDVKADNVLDIGGSQLPIEGRTKSWEVKNYSIIDLPRPHFGDDPNIALDIEDRVDTLLAQEINRADVIFCIEVAEYWTKPVTALENINKLMKSGGILYISFHFIYPIHKPSGFDYLRYTEHGVRKILSEAGFEIEDLVYRTMENGAGELGMAFGLEGMRPDKDYDHHVAQGYLVKARKL